MAGVAKERIWGKFDEILFDCIKLLNSTFQKEKISKLKF